MTSSSSSTRVLNTLAHEFVERIRQGEEPTVEEYAAEYPSLADAIRELFPTLLLVEQLGSSVGPDPQRQVSLSSSVSDLPRQLGDYRIVRQVGRGGMGVVYEAIQESLGRHVALKVLPLQEAANQIHLERFRREARAAAQLHHTNIVPIFGVGEDNGVHFYAMQFIQGQTLDNVVKELRRLAQLESNAELEVQRPTPEIAATIVDGLLTDHLIPIGTRRTEDHDARRSGLLTGSERESTVPSQEASIACAASSSTKFGSLRGEYYRSVARIGIEIAEALAYAHSQGVLHRDIKPANLLLDTQGTVWISDFGLARVQGLSELTVAGDVVGTMRYIPPERFHGQTDARGDIYGLGLTLYEMLTLRPAFLEMEREPLVNRILQSSLPPPRRSDRRIPRDLETIVLKATRREPADRYPTARAMAEDLRRFVADRPILARRFSGAERAWRWCRGNPALSALTALSALLLVGITIISLVASLKLSSQLGQTREAQRHSRQRRVATLLAQSRAVRLTARSGQRFEATRVLQEATQIARELGMPPETFGDLKNEYIAALCLPDVEAAESLISLPAKTVVDFDPQFERYALGGEDGTVSIHRVAGGALREQLPGPGLPVADYGGLVFSPDGRYLQHLCYTRDGSQRHLRLWDLADRKPRLVLDMPGVLWAAFRPDSQQIAVKLPTDPAAQVPIFQFPAPAEIRVFETASGRERSRPYEATDLASFAFHPTKSQLAVTDSSSVRIIDLDSGRQLDRWDSPGHLFPVWDEQGRRLATTNDTDLLIHLWDTARHQALTPLEGHRSKGIVYTFDHRGDLMASIDWSGVLRLWDPRSGRLLMATSGGELTTQMRFSANDRLLSGVRGKGTMRLMRMAPGRELQRLDLQTPPGSDPGAVMSPDGRLLAATSLEGTVLFDALTGEQLAVIPGARFPLLFESSDSLLTHAFLPEGLVRWSLRRDPTDPRRLQPCPPEQLAASHQAGGQLVTSTYGGKDQWAASRDGRVIAMPNYDGGTNLFVAEPTDHDPPTKYRRLELGPQNDVRFCAVSPDGKWVVSGSHYSPGTVALWDVATGRHVRDLAADRGIPRFSPDGRWLAVVSNSSPTGGRLWEVDSWEPGPLMSLGYVAFSSNGGLMAVESDLSVVRLVVPDTGRELARLTVPEATRVKPECFTPDGTRLVAFGLESGQLYVWNLQSIRRRLVELGLDWDDVPHFAAGN